MIEEARILNGNKLIAEFMGMTANKHDNGKTYAIGEIYLIDGCECAEDWKPLIFHSSWDWLMPVVEKISHIKIQWKNSTDIDTYYPRTFGMLQEYTNLPMFRFNGNAVYVGNTLIEAAWNAVVDFLEQMDTKK